MGRQRTPQLLFSWPVRTSDDLLASTWSGAESLAVDVACHPLEPLPFLLARRVLGQAGHHVTINAHVKSPSKGIPMTTHISVPLGSEKIHNTADGANQILDLMACPECSMTAALQWGNRVESTDGPVDHVRVTCVNQHWFLMPVDALTDRPRNH